MQETAIHDEVQEAPSSVSEMAEERLLAWNALNAEAAAQSILPCNGSRTWAGLLSEQRPFATAEELFKASDHVWAKCSAEDQKEAFDSHPRIGEGKAVAATTQSLQWSHGEQSAANPDEAARAALHSGNQVYEEKFGRIFIVCASGKSATEMLMILNQRLANDPETELKAAAEEQRKIMQLRLCKWLGLEPALAAVAEGQAR